MRQTVAGFHQDAAGDWVAELRSSTEWDERTLPPGLRRDHQLGAGTWGRIVVTQGTLRFSIDAEPTRSVELTPRSAEQAIPPQAPHSVQPLGRVRFRIDFFTVRRDGAGAPADGSPA
jgi:tellurite resistance-related uncharacterized protein